MLPNPGLPHPGSPPPPPVGRSVTLWVAGAVWLGATVAANMAFHRWPTWSVLIGVTVTGAMVGISRWARIGVGDLGLARSTWLRGLRWGGTCVAIAAIGYGVALLIPAARNAVTGTTATWPQALTAALLVIPLGTVIPEEFAFRGVLWGLVNRDRGRWTATVVSSTLFGVWHVAPALGGGSANQAIDAVAGDGTLGLLLRLAGTVLFTGAAGVLFCELRVRSGSLLTPVLAHWAVNGIGVLFVQFA